MEQNSLDSNLGMPSSKILKINAPFQSTKSIIQIESAPEEKDALTKQSFNLSEEKRIIFVGNASLECKKNKIRTIMGVYGEVERV